MVDVVRINGLDIAYRLIGQGSPLVFVHGAGDDSRIWQPQLSALSDEFTVVAWDEPGAGESSDLPAQFGLADYARCLAAFIDALALGPAHVAGISWGRRSRAGALSPARRGRRDPHPRGHIRRLEGVAV
jgi:pimeloyl-ACP methyl ester carboxylesterase